MCTELILQIELSIHWNGITGMGNRGAIGQLIPAIIGVGGLVRVVRAWWSNSENEEAGMDIELKECAELYRLVGFEHLKRLLYSEIQLN